MFYGLSIALIELKHVLDTGNMFQGNPLDLSVIGLSYGFVFDIIKEQLMTSS